MNETRQCENAFCSLLVLPWRRVFAPSLPVGEACVGSTAGEGAPGPLERRSELGRHGLAWRAHSRHVFSSLESIFVDRRRGHRAIGVAFRSSVRR